MYKFKKSKKKKFTKFKHKKFFNNNLNVKK